MIIVPKQPLWRVTDNTKTYAVPLVAAIIVIALLAFDGGAAVSKAPIVFAKTPENQHGY